MFIGFSKRLKAMAGFRICVGIRLNKWVALFVIPFIGIFYLMWYSLILCGWMIYGICYIYYWLFKLIASGFKKLAASSRSSNDTK